LLTEHDHPLPSHSALLRGFPCQTDGRTSPSVTARIRPPARPQCAALHFVQDASQPPCGIDIHIEVPPVEYDPVVSAVRRERRRCYARADGKLTDDRLGEPSASIRARIERARETQRQRFAGAVGGANGKVPLLCNAEMPALAQSPKRSGVGQRRHKCGPGGSARILPAGRLWQEPAACPVSPLSLRHLWSLRQRRKRKA